MSNEAAVLKTFLAAIYAVCGMSFWDESSVLE